jgi:D-alanyl-D-alanine carboxypeptidase
MSSGIGRGIGSIVVDDDKVQARPTGVGQGLIRTFSTQLPEHDYSQQIKTGKMIQDVADDMLRITGTEAADKAARETKIAKDAEGNYIRPESPMMGLALRGHYNKIVDQRFIETVNNDIEADLNGVASQYFQDPQKAGPLMAQAVSARLNKVADEGLRTQLATLANREVTQRMRGITDQRSRMDFRNEVEHLDFTIKANEDKYHSALLVNDQAKAKEHEEIIMGAHARKVVMGVESAAMGQSLQFELGQTRESAKLFQVLEQKLEDGTITEDHFRLYGAWLAGGGSDEDVLDNVDKKSIFAAMPSQKVRDAARIKLSQIEARYRAHAAGRAEAEMDGVLERHWNTVGRGQLPLGASETDFARYWSKRWGDQLTPKGILEGFTKTGDVPQTMVARAFAGVRVGGPAKARELLQVYNTLAALPTPDGGSTSAKLAGIPEDAAALMYHFAQGITTDGSADGDAFARAEKLVADGEKRWSDSGKPMEILREAMQKDGTLTSYSGGVNNTTLKTHIFTKAKQLADGGAQDLDAAAETALFGSIARRVALGQSLDTAIEHGLGMFQKTWTHSTDLYSPDGKGRWVRRGTEVPVAFNTGGRGQQTSDYVKPIVGALLRAKPDGTQPKDDEAKGDYLRMIPLKQAGGIEVKDPEWGRNIKAVPAGEGGDLNPTFHLIYQPHPQHPGVVLRDNGLRPIKLQLKHEAKIQGEAALRHLKDDGPTGFKARAAAATAAQPSSTMDWASQTQEQIAAGAKPADPNKRGNQELAPAGVSLDRVLVRDPLPEIKDPGTVDKGSRAGGRRFAPPRINDGTTPNLLQPVGYTGGDAPAPNLVDQQALFAVQAFAYDDRRKLQVNGLKSDFVQAIHRGIQDMPPEIRKVFRIASAHRSNELQTKLWNDEVALRGSWAAAKRAGMVAQPGGSKHEHGDAIDIDRRSPGAMAAIQWWHENGHKYGVHFPLDTPERRKNGNAENWHLEPIRARRVPMAAVHDADGDDDHYG